jgi:hypothetical protein
LNSQRRALNVWSPVRDVACCVLCCAALCLMLLLLQAMVLLEAMCDAGMPPDPQTTDHLVTQVRPLTRVCRGGGVLGAIN